jgi:membrane protein YdbS with pleckstrin-like domain
MDEAALPEPRHRLPAAARSYWRLVIAVRTLLLAPVALFAGAPVTALGLPFWVPVALELAGGLLAAALVPDLWWRRWRYEIREDELDLRHGLWTVRRTLVPIRRVQHVDTTSGPLQSAFGLASVSFHTAAGETKIPALTEADAEAVRRRVGELARTRDDV